MLLAGQNYIGKQYFSNDKKYSV